ncbi:hypothetical protein ICV01_06210 [Polynucleobacter sp. MWH-Spelu-300-X4]|uniref:AbiH family protein n=1 Tax=Polynucleobacter sp. MWH-Spelu-300-X4 TaxID=2689109 RepID=UPI001BFE0FE3|nr:AbiH family protein [Polynucleobacter sp. MWH-Spelu-300-X4]QWD79241.1 hypothetical protein ICV01_06210 [Polynucleobacter sp. MWH-Spelu-300-X4]
MRTKVVIIGNGFDLDQGLRTAYSHFLEDGVQPGVDTQNAIIQAAKNQGENWCDVEMALAQVIAREAKLAENKGRQRDIKRNYMQVSRLLKKYIEGIQIHRKSKFDDSVRSFQMIKDLLSSDYRSIKIFDFNYTNTVSNILKYLPQKNGVEHIKVHGSIDDGQIIYGVENYADILIPSKFTYAKKSHGDLFYSTTRISDELIGADEIHLFGHSLGESDEIHFSRYFDEVMTTEINPINAKQEVFLYLDSVNIDACKERINERIDSLTNSRLAEFKQAVSVIYK